MENIGCRAVETVEATHEPVGDSGSVHNITRIVVIACFLQQ